MDEGTIATTVNGKWDNTSAKTTNNEEPNHICPTLLLELALSTKKRTVYSEGPVKGESYTNYRVIESSPLDKVASTSLAGTIDATGEPEKDDTAWTTDPGGKFTGAGKVNRDLS